MAGLFPAMTAAGFPGAAGVGMEPLIEETTSMPKPGKKKPKCENCEGKGLIKLGDKKVKCQRCGGTGYQSRPIATG
jgi:hypothetical protein